MLKWIDTYVEINMVKKIIESKSPLPQENTITSPIEPEPPPSDKHL